MGYHRGLQYMAVISSIAYATVAVVAAAAASIVAETTPDSTSSCLRTGKRCDARG
jgi:hypothetical protein